MQQEGGGGVEGGVALIDYGHLFLKEPPTSGAEKTNFPNRVADEELGKAERELKSEKERLIRVASVSLMGRPDLENPSDPTRIAVLEAAMSVAERDAEFVLKMALYCRQELNVRLTSNLLLAFCAWHPPCRPYVARYFPASVRLPSDWMQVADLVMTFPGVAAGALPAALRKAMVEKFEEFDEYQLAKYNRERKGVVPSYDDSVESQAKMKASASGKEWLDLLEEDWTEVAESVKDDQRVRRRRFNLKRLIRVLHINRPAQYVMAILGKK